MNNTLRLRWIKPVLILSLVCSFALTATAQNYYPADIGNMWVLDSTDGEEQTTYTLEGPEIIGGKEHILLRIRNEEFSTGDIETDQYFLTVGTEAINLHRIILEDEVATLIASFATPVVFFPLQLELGDTWQIAAKAEAKLEDFGLSIPGQSITDLEVVGFEDVDTPAGTFQNCAKIEFALNLTAGGFFTLESTTYQWFAPDIGPIQYENSDGLMFKLASTNVSTAPEEPDTTAEDVTPEPTPEEPDTTTEDVTPEPTPEEPDTTAEDITPEPTPEEDVLEPQPYDVNGDGVVNILDLTFVAFRFGESDSDGDVTGDGEVNILDLVAIAQNFDQ